MVFNPLLVVLHFNNTSCIFINSDSTTKSFFMGIRIVQENSVQFDLPQVSETTVHTYHDFVVTIKRTSDKKVEVAVPASPAGALPKSCGASFTAKRENEIKLSFRPGGSNYNFEFGQADAVKLGKELSAVLLPQPVFNHFTESLARVLRNPGNGLRLRLAVDANLIDLPWEYVYRPDNKTNDGISGFLLLDPTISMVRELPNPRIRIEPVKGKQKLVFAGTYWEKNNDGWEVKKEFDKITGSLKPVSKYIDTEFRISASNDAFDMDGKTNSTIFHYAGHCDFDKKGESYLIRELPRTEKGKLKCIYAEELSKQLSKAGVRLVVLSACNSGYWQIVKPFLDEEIPAVIGVNGVIASQSTIEFCKKLYESLAVGLSLDEAVCRARLNLLRWDAENNLFDWGLYMIYMQSSDAVLFPRSGKEATQAQVEMRTVHEKTANETIQHAKDIDGMNYSEIMSHTSKRRVLILGRFKERRIKILKLIKEQLEQHPNQYIPELYTYEKPDKKDLVDSICGFALLSKFIIADISEPSAVQGELQAIDMLNTSVPIVPIINKTGKEYALFPHIAKASNVAKPTIRYSNEADVIEKLKNEVIPAAEKLYEAAK